MADVKTGGCLCGAVRYRVQGPLREVIYCHCGQCRRQTGLYYAATNVADADLSVTGADNITWYQSSTEARRGFCKVCGSALFWKHEGAEAISIQAGSVDMPTGLVAGYHIFCEDKGDFYEIDDDLPKFRKSSPDVVTNVE